MRGLPELLNLVDEIYHEFEEPSKMELSIPSLPVVFLEERPTLKTLSRPINRQLARRSCPYARITAARNELAKSKEKDFSVALDVSSFQPEEISVKVKDRDIIVEAKHEERKDEYGYVSRQFTRRYQLPDEYDPDSVSTYLNADGKMTIKALKPKVAEPHERIIPIKRVTDVDHEEEQEKSVEKEKRISIESANSRK
uniref:Small heat shock protein 23 n=1 Tax=Polypedilum vanderplanki TaxID=319348 RepID=E1AC56_POLVA|nr:small heat shock protein 23 [Polypedilum vanderplanki]